MYAEDVRFIKKEANKKNEATFFPLDFFFFNVYTVRISKQSYIHAFFISALMLFL